MWCSGLENNVEHEQQQQSRAVNVPVSGVLCVQVSESNVAVGGAEGDYEWLEPQQGVEAAAGWPRLRVGHRRRCAALRTPHFSLSAPLRTLLLVQCVCHEPCALCSAVAAVVFMLADGEFRSQTVYLEPAITRFNVTKSTMTLMSTGVFVVSQLLSAPLLSIPFHSTPLHYFSSYSICSALLLLLTVLAPSPLHAFYSAARRDSVFNRFTVQCNRFSSSLRCFALPAFHSTMACSTEHVSWSTVYCFMESSCVPLRHVRSAPTWAFRARSMSGGEYFVLFTLQYTYASQRPCRPAGTFPIMYVQLLACH